MSIATSILPGCLDRASHSDGKYLGGEFLSGTHRVTLGDLDKTCKRKRPTETSKIRAGEMAQLNLFGKCENPNSDPKTDRKQHVFVTQCLR